jgi:hypothetical protein
MSIDHAVAHAASNRLADRPHRATADWAQEEQELIGTPVPELVFAFEASLFAQIVGVARKLPEQERLILVMGALAKVRRAVESALMTEAIKAVDELDEADHG